MEQATTPEYELSGNMIKIQLVPSTVKISKCDNSVIELTFEDGKKGLIDSHYVANIMEVTELLRDMKNYE
jgi:hypothetical protein